MGLELIAFKVQVENIVNSNIQSFDWHRMKKKKKMTLYIIFAIKKLSCYNFPKLWKLWEG